MGLAAEVAGPVGFTGLGVFGKDPAIIAEFPAGLPRPTPLFSLASAFYAAALAQGHGEHDTASVHAVLRGMSPAGPPRRE